MYRRKKTCEYNYSREDDLQMFVIPWESTNSNKPIAHMRGVPNEVLFSCHLHLNASKSNGDLIGSMSKGQTMVNGSMPYPQGVVTMAIPHTKNVSVALKGTIKLYCGRKGSLREGVCVCVCVCECMCV